MECLSAITGIRTPTEIRPIRSESRALLIAIDCARAPLAQ
jgi:hypothetical protein